MTPPTLALPDADELTLEIFGMKAFLSRVIQTALGSIRITGNPETDQNTDLVKRFEHTNAGGVKCSVLEMLDKVQAVGILILIWEVEEGGTAAGDRLALARVAFSDYLSGRKPIYP